MITKLDRNALHHITTFEGLTGVKIKDYLQVEDTIVFLIPDEYLSLALRGGKVKKLKDFLNKNIKVIGYTKNVQRFIRNIFHDCGVKGIEIKEDKATVFVEPRYKKKAIGRDGKNLRVARQILRKHSCIEEVRIA